METDPLSTSQYQALVQEAENHTYLSNAGELPASDATIQLVLVALRASKAGLSDDAIITALIEGEARSVTLYSNLQARNDRNYWQAVKEEAEAFWANRYDPNAKEDW